MNKREQITQLIETFIKDYCPKEKTTISAGEVRKWPAVDKLCENSDYANICRALDKISVQHQNISGTNESSTYTISF